MYEGREKKTGAVILFTVLAMIAEIYLGKKTGSMSLLAEGWHMGTHVLTLSLTYIAYVLVRKLKDSKRFEHGPYKIGILAGYTSAIFLGLTGVEIMAESVSRLFTPENIQYKEALYGALFALVINFICILIMEGKFKIRLLEHTEEHNHKDYNYKAAYYHILSDLMISILTIIALLIGKYFNCIHFDAFTGITGALLIIIWAAKLLKHTVKILTDMK